MKNLSAELRALKAYIEGHQILSVSFDIDGTLYPMKKVQRRWWQSFLLSPRRALRFLEIRKRWEKRRQGSESVEVLPSDVEFFENFLGALLGDRFVPSEIRIFLEWLKARDVKIYFLTDHGAQVKLQKLKLSHVGESINCLRECGELKPHFKIASLMRERFSIAPEKHLHLGDRWTDEAQAQILGSHFRFLRP